MNKKKMTLLVAGLSAVSMVQSHNDDIRVQVALNANPIKQYADKVIKQNVAAPSYMAKALELAVNAKNAVTGCFKQIAVTERDRDRIVMGIFTAVLSYVVFDMGQGIEGLTKAVKEAKAKEAAAELKAKIQADQLKEAEVQVAQLKAAAELKAAVELKAAELKVAEINAALLKAKEAKPVVVKPTAGKMVKKSVGNVVKKPAGKIKCHSCK